MGPNTPILGSSRKYSSGLNGYTRSTTSTTPLPPLWRAVPYTRLVILLKTFFFLVRFSVLRLETVYLFYLSSLIIEDCIFPQSTVAELSMRPSRKFCPKHSRRKIQVHTLYLHAINILPFPSVILRRGALTLFSPFLLFASLLLLPLRLFPKFNSYTPQDTTASVEGCIAVKYFDPITNLGSYLVVGIVRSRRAQLSMAHIVEDHGQD